MMIIRYLTKTFAKTNDTEDFRYEINDENTASIIKNKKSKSEILIPRSFRYHFAEYIVTGISFQAFMGAAIKSVVFSENSELRTIGKYAFSLSSLERITIPAHVTRICEGAFMCCNKLTHVEFQPNSELQIIEKKAFNCVKSLQSITIPAHVTRICEEAFSCCPNLVRVEFQPNSELQTIGKKAFFFSLLERISIPASVVDLKEGFCHPLFGLKSVEVESGNPKYLSVDGKYIIGKSDITKEYYDTFIICVCDMVKISIPETIKIIGSYAFYCSNLESISFPASVVNLRESWFNEMNHLKHVEVESGNPRYLSVDGKYIIGKSDITLEYYDTFIICIRNIDMVSIPGTIKIIGPYAFSNSKISRISIPAHVTQICKGAFMNCYQLTQIEFQQNSELQTIEKNAFANSRFESILIPKHVIQICKNAFSTGKLKIAEIDENSVIESINKNSFNNNAIIMLPTQKKHILI